MAKIFEYENCIDFEKHLLWQYSNSENLKALLLQKQAWYDENHKVFWNIWIKNVLEIAGANDFGLAVWGNLLQVARTYEVNGKMVSLDTEQYRLLLNGRLLYLKMNGSVPSTNKYLKLMFGKLGRAYVLDRFDMSLIYILEFRPCEKDLLVLNNTSALPRSAGVGYKIYVIPPKSVFGFYGSNLQGFGQAVFWDCLDWKNK